MLATIYALLSAFDIVMANEADDVLSQIDRMASLGEKADKSLIDAITDSIEKNPAQVSNLLLRKINEKNLTEQQLTVYVWALGLTKDQAATNSIIDLCRQNKDNELIARNCLCALATIGGKQAEAFILTALDAEPDSERRFDTLNLLVQVQCEDAIPKTEEILKKDPKEYYWQSIFIFGKLGDKSVPFLLERVNNKDLNIRTNAIIVLGQWLIPPEAAKPLQDQFWKEEDTEVRRLILNSLERTITDLGEMKNFFEQVINKEKDANLTKFANETLDSVDRTKAELVSYSEKKSPSASSFNTQYDQLFKSAGKEGNYEMLEAFSTIQDEPKLKALRERILQRDSDEAFYDYQNVNGIIIKNRLIDKMEK